MLRRNTQTGRPLFLLSGARSCVTHRLAHHLGHRLTWGLINGLAFGLIFLFVSVSAEASTPDSLDTNIRDSIVELPQVEVATSRIQTSITRPASIVNRQAIERLPLQDLGDIVSLAPGVFVKSYGGLGGVQTLSLRGSTAPQTLVLLDGVRLNSVRNGAVDLALLPPALVEDVQVVRGGAAALYGGNALGGVVNIRGRRLRRPLMFGAGLERASFNEWRLSAYGGVRYTNTQISGALALDKSDGDYPFDFNQFGEDASSRRANGDALIRAGMLNLQSVWAPLHLFTTVLLRDAERGSPGAVVQGNIEDASARLFDDDISILGGAELERADWRAGLLFNLRRANQTYIDPEFFGPDPSRHTFDFRENEASLALHGSVDYKLVKLESRLEYTHAALASDQLQNVVGDRVTRRHAALALIATKGVKLTSVQLLSLEAALRVDAYAQFPSVVSPLFALAWTLQPQGLTFRAQVSDNYRPPSFNELYYVNFGSSDLRPERGVAAGIGADLGLKTFNISLDYFGFWTRDQIIAVPRSPIAWSARNLGRVTGQGLELAAQGWLVEQKLEMRVAGTLQRATDQSPQSLAKGEEIVYVPGELLNVAVLYKHGDFDCGFLFEFTGERLTLPGGGADSRLPSYSLLNLFAAYNIELGSHVLTARVQMDNVFNSAYTVVRNYPMPGRRLSLRLDAVFKQ